MKYKEGVYTAKEINVKELIEYCREHDDIVVGFGSLDDNNEDPEKYPIHIYKADSLKIEPTTVVWRDTITGLTYETELSEFNSRVPF